MSNWKQSQFYCQRCGKWYGNIQHRDCPLGERRSLIWIDIDNFQMGCNNCNQAWQPEDTTYYCPNGHTQQTEYTDSAVALHAEDQVLATDGIWVYVLTQSGTVVVGRRDLDNVRYTD